MAATPKFRFPFVWDWALAGRAVSLGRRYIGLRVLLTLGVESLWLVVSSLVLLGLNQSAIETPVTILLTVDQVGLLAGTYLFVFFLMDLYNLDLVTPPTALRLNLFQAIGILCVIIGLLQYSLLLFPMPAWMVLAHLALTATVVLAGRAAIDRYVKARRPPARIGFVGTSAAAAQLREDSGGLSALGFRAEILGDSVQQAITRLWQPSTRISRIVIDDEQSRTAEANEFLQQCRRLGIPVEELSAFRERALGKVRLGPNLVHELAFSAGRRSWSVAVGRRLRDAVLAALGLLITLPLSLLIALAIKCDSPGPVLFSQERIGRNRRSFRMIKFRSMYQNAECAPGTFWTTSRRDPRVTRVGALLRLLHLDELPQLINVLKGDMSLIGPRPFHPSHFARLEGEPYFVLRQIVLPGITGWAQVRCDYAASLENYQEVLTRDLYYIKYGSFLFDLLILLDTLRICIWRRGAC
jgi:exopolysaccharide biosynthesis polyprenyl glycosylphosphotransferase